VKGSLADLVSELEAAIGPIPITRPARGYDAHNQSPRAPASRDRSTLKGLTRPGSGRTPPSSDCSAPLTHRADFMAIISRDSLASATFWHSHRRENGRKSVFSNSPIRTRSAAEARPIARRLRYSCAAGCCCHCRRSPGGHAFRSAPGSRAPAHPPATLPCPAAKPSSKQGGSAGRHHQGPHPQRTLRRAQARLSCGCAWPHSTPSQVTPCSACVLRAPLAAMPAMGMAATAIATAERRCPAQIRTDGRCAGPFVKAQSKAASQRSQWITGAAAVCAPVRIPTSAAGNWAHRIRDLKSKTGAPAVGAATAHPPDRPSHGASTKWQEQTPPGRWARVKTSRVRS